jgi:Leucine-rich repeat (LRR) protein
MLRLLYGLTGLLLLSTLVTATTPHADDAEDRAVAAVEKLGGKVVRDPKQPGNPVISVNLLAKKVNDEALKDLAGLKQLLSLDLRTTQVTDAGLKELRAFPKLRDLYLSSTKVTDAGLKELRAIDNLQRLEITSTAVTDAGLKELRELTKLQALSLNNTKVTDAGLKELHGLKNLKTLTLDFTRVTIAGLRDLRAALPQTRITPQLDESEEKAIAAVEKLGGRVLRKPGSPSVTSVIFTGKPVTDAALRDLGDFKKLAELSLSNTPITDLDLKELGQLKSLTSLYLAQTRVTAKGIAELRALGNLKTLDLAYTDLKNEGVKQLRDFTNLRTLILFNTQIDGNALKDLRNLKDLQMLDLGGNYGIGDNLKDLDLKQFGGLESLNLSFTAITDASLAELRALAKLKTLTLGTSRAGTMDITDKGLKELKGIASLQTLNLVYTGTTPAGRDDLKAALPTLKIVDLAGKQGVPEPKGITFLPKDTKPDLTFLFDYSDLNLNTGDTKKDAALKAARESFEKNIRNQVYPVLRDITGVYLGKYVKEIRYTLVRDKSLGGGAGGVTLGINQVKLEQTYSLGNNPPNDIHEMIHVFNANTGVLHGDKDHIWHGALQAAVGLRLGWQTLSRDRVVEELKNLLNLIERPNAKLTPDQLRSLRSGILGDQLTLFYYERGDKALGMLYRSTMNPRPTEKPSPRLVEAWGAEANKVQALLETLKKEFKFTFDERTQKACGF